MSSGTGRATSQNSGIDFGRRSQRIAASPEEREPALLGRFFWRLDPKILHHHLQILPRLALLARISKQICRMISYCKTRSGPRWVAPGRLEVVPVPAQFAKR